MRVLMNWLASIGQKTGIGRYIAELVPAIQAQLQPGETLDCFPQGLLRKLYAWRGALPQAPGGSGSAGGAKPSWFAGLKKRLICAAREFIHARLNGSFRATLRRGRYDLYHEPNCVPMDCDAPTLTTLHDLSVLLYPQWHPASRVAHYEKYFRNGLNRSIHILTDTAAVRNEIVQHLGIPRERITPVHLGVNPAVRPVPADELPARLKQLGLPERYLLCVGTIEPRKNQLMLLRAYVSLPAAIRDRYPLLMVGGLGWHTEEITYFLQGEGRSRGVIHLGYLPDEALPTVYTAARAMLFPSHYEGFGLPPLEMQACGGAVIASTADSLSEILAGSPAHLLDANDADGWRESLQRVCTDDDWWQSLRSGAKAAAARFTWERCATQTLGVYRNLSTARQRQAA